MTLARLEHLAQTLRDSGAEMLEFAEGDTHITLRARPRPGATASTAPRPQPSPQARAPIFGHFRTAHPLTGILATTIGAAVRAGDILGFVELEEALHPVLAPADGTVTAVLAEDGALVGYGAALVALG